MTRELLGDRERFTAALLVVGSHVVNHMDQSPGTSHTKHGKIIKMVGRVRRVARQLK